MERKQIPDIVKNFIHKYKYVVLVLLLGIGLMLLPDFNNGEKQATVAPTTEEHKADDFSKELSAILSQVSGAGKVNVILNILHGQKTVYQTDCDSNVSESSSSVRQQTVTLTDSARNQFGLVQQINPPVYLGAIVVCQGADNPAVRLSIVEAVSKITGLSSNQISVLKMK